MNWLTHFFRKQQSEQQLDAELRFHLEKQIADYAASGLSREEARRRANLHFGAVESIKQQSRESRRANVLETVWQDFRFALRMLRKSPGFTSVAVLTLALGIGANTALFSLLNALILRDLPVSHPEQLVRFSVHQPDELYGALSLPMFQEIARDQKVFSNTFAWWGDAVTNVEINGVLTRAETWAVDGHFFSELGATPEIGRLLTPDDVDLAAPSPQQLVVLGYGFWQRHYGAATDVLGKTIKIEGAPFTIIGVTRDGFTGFSADSPPEVLIPLNAEPLIIGDTDVQKHLQRREALWLDAAGRLKSGVTLGQARAQLESLWPTIRKSLSSEGLTPDEMARFLKLRMKVESGARGDSEIRKRFTKPLYIVLGISGVVLFLACLNLANLTLARASARAHEMAARVALGASRVRLVRQMLTESLAVSFAGTIAGFFFANWVSALLASFILRQAFNTPAQLNLSPDMHLFLFTAGAAIATGVLVGIAPAWRATQEDPNLALQRNAGRFAGGAGKLGQSLIVAQVALSLMLLAGAGLFVRSIEKLHTVRPGFRTRGVLAAGLFPRPNGYKNLSYVSYYRELVDRVSKLPSVDSAGMVRMTPGNSFEWKEQVRIPGKNADNLTATYVMLMPGSFTPLGISLLQGRDFNWQDDEHAPRVVIVSKNFAEKAFPGCGAIGQHLEGSEEAKRSNVEIVGVVSDASFYDLRKSPPLTIYAPTTQYGDNMGYSDLIVQTAASPAAVGDAIRRTVDSMGHEYVFSLKTVGQLIDKTFLQERVTAMLSAFFGGLALLLAAIGLYSQMAYSVTRRTREIGIRIALGARRTAVQQMVLREALMLAALGVALGVPCAILASRLIAAMLFGLSPHDPSTLAGVIGILLAVSTFASYLPARRAMHVDPMIALRHE
ncbi:MAG TPA: ABC transporter permease [Candidatus Methylomirabilis sp.]|nr:ABC transporter permease [Candidatus Methylomirabilis sp.]